MLAWLMLQTLALPPAGVVVVAAELGAGGVPLRAPALLLEVGGERLLATRQSAWMLPGPQGTERPLELVDWGREVKGARVELAAGALALEGPARGGLDAWWCDVLLLRMPAQAELPAGAPPCPTLPEVGQRLWLGGLPGAPRPVEVLETLQEPGVPAQELLASLPTDLSAAPAAPAAPAARAAPTQPELLGLPVFDAQGRAVGLVTDSGAEARGPWLRIQCLAPALALPAPLLERRLEVRVPAGLFDRLSASGDQALLSSNLFQRTLGVGLDSGSIAGFDSWQQYRGVHYSPDGLFAVGMHPMRGIEWVEALGLEVLSRYGRLFDQLGALEFAPDGARLFAADAGAAGLFELELGSDQARRLADLGGMHLAVGPGGDWLAIGGGERGREVELLSTAASGSARLALLEVSQEPSALAAAPDAPLLALAAGSELALHAGPDWYPRWRVQLGPGEIRALLFEPGAELLWVAQGSQIEQADGARLPDGCSVSLLSLADGHELARSQRLADLPFDLCPRGPGRILAGDQAGRLTEFRLPLKR